MNDSPVNQSVVRISGKEYRITYPDGQEKRLTEAAELLNRRIAEVKSEDTGVGNEQAISVTALNLAHDLLKQDLIHQKQRQYEIDVIKNCLRKISTKLNKADTQIPRTDFPEETRF